MKRLMDIYTKSDVAGHETRMSGRILLDEDNHFEGIVSSINKGNNRLVVGDILSEKDYGLVELTIYRTKGEEKPAIKLEAEKTKGTQFTGKSYLKTDHVMAECGECAIRVYDGEMIREVTQSEVYDVERGILFAIQDLNEDSLNQYMERIDIKRYRKRNTNR